MTGLDLETIAACDVDPELIAIADATSYALHQRGTAGRSRRHLLVAAAIMLGVLACATTLSAAGLGPDVRNVFSFGDRGAHESIVVPGPVIDPTSALKSAAAKSGITDPQFHSVVATGTGRHRFRLVATGSRGRLYVAQTLPGMAGEFVPVRMRNRHADGVVAYLAYGASGTNLRWASLVGYAAPHVSRIVATLANGQTQSLLLNSAGGFAFTTEDPMSVPRTLKAFDQTGIVIETKHVALSSLCGTNPAPCPAIVLPGGEPRYQAMIVTDAAGHGAEIPSSPEVIDSFFDLSNPLNGDRSSVAAQPTGAYFKLYLVDNTGFPGVPGRFYPASRAACFSWDQSGQAPSPCIAVNDTLAKALLPMVAGLPGYAAPPTVLTRLRSDDSDVLGTSLRAAIELGFDRFGDAEPAPKPDECHALTAAWAGPMASARPTDICISVNGLYAGGKLYPLGPGAAQRILGG